MESPGASRWRRTACLLGTVRSFRAAALLAAAIGLVGCQDKHEWNQKLTVVVDTPSGQVSGSSVVEVKATFGALPMTDREVWYRVRGEATAVEVAPGRYLFALLGGSKERYYRAVRDQLKHVDRGDWLKRIPKMRGVVILEPKNYPQLVAFRDIDNPNSVREVDPNNLAATFGKGFSLDKITLEITDDSVTKRPLEPLLSWLGPHPETRLGPATGRTANIPFYRRVSYGDFVRRNK